MIKEQIQQQRIEKANKVHNYRYDYSKSDFTNTRNKTCIICPEHGEFHQSVVNHLRGSGCPRCAGKATISLEEFIERANKVHNYKYDYSKVKFTKMSDKVCIICPEHGEFYQTVCSHLRGSGCPKCAGCANISRKEFIERSNKVHNYKYDYSKVTFTNTKDKVCIICPEHGEFYQQVRQHLAGQGCPNCAGLRKSYKFDLLKEFESEYALRDFLMTSHVYILIKILTNLCERSPKFKPIEDDLRKALMNSDNVNPIKYLEEKYSGMTADEMETDTKIDINDIDWDDDDAIDQIASKNDILEKEITIADLTKSERNVQKVLSKIKNMVTPEIREQIEAKYVNDKIRQYFDEYGM